MSNAPNEEQAVLQFFSQEENLELALAVADAVDVTRQRMNNEFWNRLAARLAATTPGWQVALTEDRNVEDSLVGLYLQPDVEQALFLRPMMEQQIIGGVPRIYFGLMWSATAEPQKKSLDPVAALCGALEQEGFKTSDNFLAWQWSPYYPRSKKFLMRLSTSGDKLLDEAAGLLRQLIETHGSALAAANAALREAPRTVAVSLDGLRASLKHEKNATPKGA